MLLTNWLKPLLSRRFWSPRVSTTSRRRQKLLARYRPVSGVEQLEDRTLLAFHLWDIDEVFSSLDGTIQFIELKNASDFESFLSGQSFTTNANDFTFPSNLPNQSTANTTFLMATSGFSALPGAVTPDYVIPDNFFSVTGDTLNFALGIDVFTFTNGQLPLDGVTSLFTNLTTGTNSPKNFAGTSGSVELPPTVALSLFGSPLAEADGVATVTATLSAVFDQDVSVDLGFSGTATNVDDYTRSATSIMIAAGATTGSITLTAVQDTLGELNETIIVDITSVTSGDAVGDRHDLRRRRPVH
jgi:serralysin